MKDISLFSLPLCPAQWKAARLSPLLSCAGSSVLCLLGSERLLSPPCSLRGRAGRERPLLLPEWTAASRATVRDVASMWPAGPESH